jgi:uncharacterized protein DUF4240
VEFISILFGKNNQFVRNNHMDAESFWDLIDKTREAANGDARKQSDLLMDELVKLPAAEEIIAFDHIFDDLKDKAYIGNLWDAATLIMHGSGDDGFQEFREWLVGRGKEAYENAIQNPETLVDVLEVGEQIFPTLLGSAMGAYEKVTGKNMPPMPREWAQLQGRPKINMDADEAELLADISARFPRLTAKFWEWWTRDKIYLEIRDMLRERLAPLGFSETGKKLVFGIAKFQRNQFVVEIMLDYLAPDYSLYASSELSEKGNPIHRLAMSFIANEYDEEKRSVIKATIEEWIATNGV